MAYSEFSGRRVVPGDGLVSMSIDAVVALMDEILVEPGSFVSLTDDGGRMMQFLVDDDGGLLVDFPAPRERGSYAGRISVQGGKAALRAMGGELRRDGIAGLAFEAW